MITKREWITFGILMFSALIIIWRIMAATMKEAERLKENKWKKPKKSKKLYFIL